MADIQTSMFPDQYPEYEMQPKRQPRETPVGQLDTSWSLIGRRGRQPSYHKVKAQLGGVRGVLTVCDLQGWIITEPGHYEGQIAHICPDCHEGDTW